MLNGDFSKEQLEENKKNVNLTKSTKTDSSENKKSNQTSYLGLSKERLSRSLFSENNKSNSSDKTPQSNSRFLIAPLKEIIPTKLVIIKEFTTYQKNYVMSRFLGVIHEPIEFFYHNYLTRKELDLDSNVFSNQKYEDSDFFVMYRKKISNESLDNYNILCNRLGHKIYYLFIKYDNIQKYVVQILVDNSAYLDELKTSPNTHLKHCATKNTVEFTIIHYLKILLFQRKLTSYLEKNFDEYYFEFRQYPDGLIITFCKYNVRFFIEINNLEEIFHKKINAIEHKLIRNKKIDTLKLPNLKQTFGRIFLIEVLDESWVYLINGGFNSYGIKSKFFDNFVELGMFVMKVFKKYLNYSQKINSKKN